MSFYSSQKVFCNACGKEIEGELCGSSSVLGKNCKVCSVECLEEYKWREILSLLGKKYRPRVPEAKKTPEGHYKLFFDNGGEGG
jgi:hypothetical protein